MGHRRWRNERVLQKVPAPCLAIGALKCKRDMGRLTNPCDEHLIPAEVVFPDKPQHACCKSHDQKAESEHSKVRKVAISACLRGLDLILLFACLIVFLVTVLVFLHRGGLCNHHLWPRTEAKPYLKNRQTHEG